MTWWAPNKPAYSVETAKRTAFLQQSTIEQQQQQIAEQQQQIQQLQCGPCGSGGYWGGKGSSKGGGGQGYGYGKSAGKGQYWNQGQTHKGAGKGAVQGKGSAGGRTDGGAATSLGEKWECDHTDCAKTAGGALNNASRTACFGCTRPKNAAMNAPKASSRKEARKSQAAQQQAPPAGQQQQPQQQAVPSKRKKKSRNKDKEEPPAAAGFVPQAAGGDPPKPSNKRERKRQKRAEAAAGQAGEEDEEMEQGDALQADELSFLTRMGITQATAKAETDKLFALPKPIEIEGKAEEAVAVACGRSDSKPLKEAESYVELYQGMVNDNKGVTGREHLLKLSETNLKEWQSKLTSLKGKVVTPILSDMEAKRATEVAAEEQRLLKCKRLGETAYERYQRLRGVIAAEQKKLQDKLGALDGQYIEAQKAWSEDATQRALLHKTKLTEWDRRIAETPASDCCAAAAQPQAANVTPVITIDNNVHQPTPGVIPADYNRATRWTLAEIPETATAESDHPGLAMLNQNLDCWSQSGQFPMSYNTMFTGIKDMRQGPVEVCKLLTGDIIWGRLYEGGNVAQEFIVPVQLVTILRTALSKIKDKLQADSKRLTKIHATFEDLYTKDLVDRAAAAGAYGLLPY